MKKIIIAAVCIVLLTAALLGVLNKMGPQRVYIKTLESNRFQLIVNGSPYIVKGMVYSPTPIGQDHAYDFWADPQKPHLYDGKLMKAIGVNTIRVYQPSEDPEKTKQVMKDFYSKFGIRVMMGHWLGFWDDPNYADIGFREKVKKDVLLMVSTYKDEKGILCWILGNENNVSFSYGPQTLNLWTTDEIEALDDPYLKRQARAKIYYSFVNEISREIHKIDPDHPVVLANAELTDIDVASKVTQDVDILGCSIYRGKAFGSFFREVAMKFKRPILIIEFGCDRYNSFLKEEDEGIQAEFIEAEWKEIAKNTFEGSGIGNCLGGFVFEWTDEWWKFNEENRPGWNMHDTAASWSNGAYYFDIKAPQNLNINEEWWGVCALEKHKGLDERKPTKAYFKLKELWR
ncbi:MAG: hypothetical protein KJ706_07765 [Candidatus Omnitrophica bacterium]|nr:hypothetical protein [Candidatus Omnitrophota bacterium]MBU4590698.1 hypothetical protein [Candidatus Omnitrophota bacterium]